MRQLALQIQSDATPTLDNFVAGRNGEALAALRAAAAAVPEPALVYLWGPEGSGKSHLLSGLALALREAGRPAALLVARRLGEGPPGSTALEGDRLLVDGVEALAAEPAERLFHAWNRIREDGGLLVCAGRVAPGALPLPPELSSRLAWGAVYRLQPLDDGEKLAALRERAVACGMPVGEDALHYLLSHARRDLPSLMGALARLDRLSLAYQRPISIPLIRQLLHGQAGHDNRESLCD